MVTGGGSGICKGIAAAYRRFGAEVAIVSRKQDVLDAAAAEMGGVLAVAADVRDPQQLTAAVAKTVERYGKLDTLVNGAAGNFLAPAAALSPNGFRTVVEIDLNGTFNASRAAFESLRTAGDALIVNISATLHYHGTPLQIHASAAKAGVDAITRNLAVGGGRFGIRSGGIGRGTTGTSQGMPRVGAPWHRRGTWRRARRRRSRRDASARSRRSPRRRCSCARPRRRTSPGTRSSSMAGSPSRCRRSVTADDRSRHAAARRRARADR